MTPFRITSFVGTRPEAIKMAPVALAAHRRPEIRHRLIASGQHGAMCHDALAAFGLRADETLRLLPHADTLAGREEAIERAVRARLLIDRPDLVLVQGDTSTAHAAAWAARRLGIPIGHVEAGLRSYDLANPFPEERNRVAIDALSTLLFAPTPEAAANLAAEPAARGAVFITGNTVIDALIAMRARLSPAPAGPRRLILVTCHRRENQGPPMAGICAGLTRLAARGDVRMLVALHPNPAAREPVIAALEGVANVTLAGPLAYPDWVTAMAQAHLILSDSGGIQEEAPALGIPLLVLRETTERPEALASGNLLLVGTEADRIVTAAERLLDDPAAHAAMSVPHFPFGQGGAAARILDLCVAYLRGDHRDRKAAVAFAAPRAQGNQPF